MKLLFFIHVLTLPVVISLNYYFYYNGFVTLNLALIVLEILSCAHMYLYAKVFLIDRLMLFWLGSFFFISIFINGYWETGGLLNIMVLIVYCFYIVNWAIVKNQEKLLGIGFFWSIFLFLIYFAISEFMSDGVNFYKNLYYNIALRRGSFEIVDSTLTVPLLCILLLFSISFIKKKYLKFAIVVIVFAGLFALQRRGPFIIALLFFLLYLFNVKAKIIYKLFLYVPLILTIGFTLFLEDIQNFLTVIDVIQDRGVEASNEERIGLLVHFFEDLNRFDIGQYLTGNINTFKNIHPNITYYHPHNSIVTILFLSGLIPTILFVLIHNKLINALVKYNLIPQLRMLIIFYLLGFTESIMNNFSLFTLMFVSLLNYYFLLVLKTKHQNDALHTIDSQGYSKYA